MFDMISIVTPAKCSKCANNCSKYQIRYSAKSGECQKRQANKGEVQRQRGILSLPDSSPCQIHKCKKGCGRRILFNSYNNTYVLINPLFFFFFFLFFNTIQSNSYCATSRPISSTGSRLSHLHQPSSHFLKAPLPFILTEPRTLCFVALSFIHTYSNCFLAGSLDRKRSSDIHLCLVLSYSSVSLRYYYSDTQIITALITAYSTSPRPSLHSIILPPSHRLH